MRRPATIVLLTLASGAGAALFHVSYDVAELDDRLATLNRQIVADQETVHVLRAEWSFLNQPARLEELSGRYLDLRPLNGSQIADATALPVRLPVPNKDGDDADRQGVPRTALAAITAELAGPQPLLKPLPPARSPARAPVRTTARSVTPLLPLAKPIPVVGRSLDDVLADLTHGRGGPR